MLKTINILLVLFIAYGCASSKKRASLDTLEDFKTISRKEFLNIAGSLLFEGRIYLGEKKPDSDISYHNAGLCKHVFEKSPHQLSIYISRGEVAACISPFISIESRIHQSLRYKDLPSSSPYFHPISLFLQESLMVPDSEYSFGVSRPVSGEELKKLLKSIKKSKI